MTITRTTNFDRKHLYTCMALAGYRTNRAQIAKMIGVGDTTAAKKLQNGNFSKWEMLTIKDKCNMDMYDFMRSFFPEMLQQDEEGRKFVIRDRLFKILTDDFFDKY